jgi:uncharacterized membrane protein YphA (DoxX/SURF4 family)
MGFRPGKQSALAAGLGEAGGGVLIALGLATPAAGAAATGTMIPATAVHAPSGFFATSGGYEYPALLGVSAAALTLMGFRRLVAGCAAQQSPEPAMDVGRGHCCFLRGLSGHRATTP